jgi:hypothetical protein
MKDTEKLIRDLVAALDLERLADGHRDRLLYIDTQIKALNQVGVEYREKLTELSNLISELKTLRYMDFCKQFPETHRNQGHEKAINLRLTKRCEKSSQ